MTKNVTQTGGRPATDAVIPGKFVLSIGKPLMLPASGMEWRRLTDLARLESGHTPSRSRSDYWDGPIPWIGIRDATGHHGKTINDTHQYISTLGLENSSARLLPVGTVCLSRTASVGYVVMMGVPMATSQDFVNWVCGPQLSPEYLRYILMLEQASIRRFAYGTTHQTLYYPDAKALWVCVPDRRHQDQIAKVLGAVDDKIAANVELVAAVESLASGLYKQLSVAGSRPLTDLSDFVNGKAFTKGATGTGRVVIRIAELNSGLGGSTVYNEIEVADQHLARPGDLLFAWSGSLTVRRWYRPEAIINQHIFKVIPRSGIPIWLINQVLQQRLGEFKLIAADKATTMGHIQRRHLEEPVNMPTHEDIVKIDPLMTSLWHRALAAERETLLLEELRDTLMPHLMSGRLRVRDAEKQVGEVV